MHQENKDTIGLTQN